MPTIIDYARVLRTLEAEGMRCVYPNGGAFAFADRSLERHVGWILAQDPTLRAEARQHARHVVPPTAQRLSELLVDFWMNDAIRGAVWLMPKSHWAHELLHGSREWMRSMLIGMSISADALASRADAAALKFEPHESDLLRQCVTTLLDRLEGSDFTIAFRATPVLCTVHHHRQLWWQTTDVAALQILENLPLNPEP